MGDSPRCVCYPAQQPLLLLMMMGVISVFQWMAVALAWQLHGAASHQAACTLQWSTSLSS